MPELPPQYNPQDVEERRYQWWDAQGLFRADPDPSRTPFTIVIPPPNVTGILHMGHALNNTIQDILVRFQRMRGRNALWLPGTDHAGIATQNVVEKALAKEGRRRQDLGREAFIARVWEWKEQYGNTILYQLRRLGASCDWRRTRFTMDEGLSRAVREVFVRLYEQGLIYRGRYITNWCPRCQTALSDEEAPRAETKGKLYHIRYPVEGQGAGGTGQAYVEVATTRPETMLGDTAVAVHPEDDRYRALIGRHVVLPIVGRRLPVIADPIVDREFGTGAVKVTPAHDPVDFQLGRRHRLETLDVMTDDARMANVPRAYEGLDRYECRSKLIIDLETQGYLGNIDEHLHNVGHCYRCHTAIEPRLSPQWFVRMRPLAEPAIEAVTSGRITFVPERWTKVYLNWMEHIEDWCISRQIWWGHRLPVWYCDRCLDAGASVPAESSPGRKPAGPSAAGGEAAPERAPAGIIIAREAPAACPACGSPELRQDEDVLDTWFSSWLWPFSTLGWPDRTPDLMHFYPTETLVTAQEIIFFWVARMIMAGHFCMGDIPFRRVYIHGTVRDLTGKKMSKSLGNIIDPLDIIQRYGTDALRYTLVTATAVGQDVFLSEERFLAGRNFANKLWNATRYVLASAPTAECASTSLGDRWIRSRLQRTIARVTEALEACLFNDAASALHEFLWHDFCDWYLEISKLSGDSHAHRDVLDVSLRLLHPVMPFVTEELWQHLRQGAAGLGPRQGSPESLDPAAHPAAGLGPRQGSPGALGASLMRGPWPSPDESLLDEEAERDVALLKAVIVTARNLRAELHVPADVRPALKLFSPDAATRALLESHAGWLAALARMDGVSIEPEGAPRPACAAADIAESVELFMPLAGVIDVEAERRRLAQQLEALSREQSRLEARLGDERFTGRAPAEVVEQARARTGELARDIRKIGRHLATM
ncbi:MAG TPA: valine--tRNA ligase [bacterium]